MIKKLKVGNIDITKPPQTVELIPESIKYIKKEGKMTAQERLSEALRHIRNAGRSIGKAFYVLTHEGHCVEIRVDCKKLEAELEAEFGKRKSKKQAKKKETK